MFKSVQYGNTFIDLEKENKTNIFSVDSFHLVIGKNGTGKTTLLKKISKAIVAPRFDFQDCRINVEYKNRGQVAAIYYTSIPYKVDLPGISSKFKNASNPIGKHPEKTVEIDQYIQLSNQLGFSTKPICIFDLNIDFVIRRLADAIIESFTSTKHDKIVKHLLKSSSDKVLLTYISSKESSFLEELAANGKLLELLISALNFELRHQFKGINLKIFLAVVDKILLSRKDPSVHIQGFVERFIFDNTQINGIDVEISDLTIYEKNYYTLLKKEYVYLKNTIDQLGSNGLQHEEIATKSIWEIPTNKILDSIKDYKRGYIEFAWDGCSSGQLALMHQFSSIGKKINALPKKIKSVLLLIDEGDIFLHLEWQKKYIKLLNNYLSNLIVSRSLNIHVILTTHSPILMSDVPKNNVIRLDRDDENTYDHTSIKSFAASIDDIVNDTFETLPIGEFAKNLILKLLEKIDSNAQITEKDLFIIQQIDNPVLKREIEYQISKRNR